MAEHSEGLSVFVEDASKDPLEYKELALPEVPEFFSGQVATYPNRTTKDAGSKTKKYGLGLEDGEELALPVFHDYDDPAQVLLRDAHAARKEIRLQVIITDGTTTETLYSPFLVTSNPYQRSDPNGDGDPDRSTFNLKRNGDWTSA